MRRKAISIVGLAVFLVCALMLLVGNPSTSAASGGPARTLVLDLPEGKVIVELVAQKRDFLLQPITGDKVPFYSPENAVRIADALQNAGQMESLPDVLLGMAFQRPDHGRPEAGPQGLTTGEFVESTCDLVLDVQGVRVHVTLEDGPPGHLLHPDTGERYVRFSAKTGSRIVEALSAAGLERDVIAGTLVGLRNKPPEKSGEPLIESLNPPLPYEGPPCGQCASYAKLCAEVCCGSGGGCMWCTVCS